MPATRPLQREAARTTAVAGTYQTTNQRLLGQPSAAAEPVPSKGVTSTARTYQRTVPSTGPTSADHYRTTNESIIGAAAETAVAEGRFSQLVRKRERQTATDLFSPSSTSEFTPSRRPNSKVQTGLSPYATAVDSGSKDWAPSSKAGAPPKGSLAASPPRAREPDEYRTQPTCTKADPEAYVSTAKSAFGSPQKEQPVPAASADRFRCEPHRTVATPDHWQTTSRAAFTSGGASHGK